MELAETKIETEFANLAKKLHYFCDLTFLGKKELPRTFQVLVLIFTTGSSTLQVEQNISHFLLISCNCSKILCRGCFGMKR